MQQSHSIIPRPALLEAVRTGLNESCVTVLLGPRQTGKTTLARIVSESVPHSVTYDLERPAGLAALEHTPEIVLASPDGVIIIDEVQRMPRIFEILRPMCDDPSLYNRYLLLGSASSNIVRGISESLAGRIAFVDVSGFRLDEVGRENMKDLWLRGGFPRAFLASSPQATFRWLEAFTRTFLERDIPALGLRIPAITLRRFWMMLAHYHGQTWNAAELARSMDVSPRTVNSYRDILAGTFMIRVLPPWYENIGKRQVKSPKVYLRDSGVLHHLLGIASMEDLWTHSRYGASWEGFALEQVLIHFGERDAYFWSTQRGAELDLLLLRNGKRWGFEFKCTDAPSVTRSMHVASADLGLAHLYVIYPGSNRYPLAPSISALPLKDIVGMSLTG